MLKIIGAAAFVAVAFTALPASAQPSDPYDYPYCLQGRVWGYPGLCHFTTYPQCHGYGLGYGCVLWPQPSICLRMAAARPTTLSGTVIKPTS